MHKIVCQEMESCLINKWSKPRVIGGLTYGLDKRLLNISKLDGGYGIVIKNKIPVRAKLILASDQQQ